MALILHSPSSTSSFATIKPQLLRPSPPQYSSSPVKPRRSLAVKSQDSSSSSSSNSSEPQNATESTTTTSSKKQPNSGSGLGFGSSTSGTSPSPVVVAKKKQKGKKERASIIRRSPVEKPSFASSEKEGIKDKEQGQSESAFLLTWLGLGGIILVQGIALAASGFLPEEWDNFCVKYLYPSFTPTVFLFVAGTVAYGVLKYLQNEPFKSDN